MLEWYNSSSFTVRCAENNEEAQKNFSQSLMNAALLGNLKLRTQNENLNLKSSPVTSFSDSLVSGLYLISGSRLLNEMC